MKYKYLEGITEADYAFEAYGKDLSEVFENSAIALTSVMVKVEDIKHNVTKEISLENSDVEKLLFEFLEEIVFLKDAEYVLFSKFEVEVAEKEGKYVLLAKLIGENIHTENHELRNDVKAITFHKFDLKKIDEGWQSQVIVDV